MTGTQQPDICLIAPLPGWSKTVKISVNDGENSHHRFLWEDAGDVVDQPISSARASKTLCRRPTTDTLVGGLSRSRRSRFLSVSINAVGGSSPNASRMSIGVMTECCSGLVLVFDQPSAHRATVECAQPILTCRLEPVSAQRNLPKPACPVWDFQGACAYAERRNCRHGVAQGDDNNPQWKEQRQTMRLVSSWSHYLDFECNNCGTVTHVDAARDFPATVACRASKCRTSPERIRVVANGNRSVLIGLPAGYPGCRQPRTA